MKAKCSADAGKKHFDVIQDKFERKKREKNATFTIAPKSIKQSCAPW